MSSTNLKEDCCYEHCEDGLCIRNVSLCYNDVTTSVAAETKDGLFGTNQRPVCVEKVPLKVEVSECTDYSLTDSSGGREQGQPTAAAAMLLLLLLIFSIAQNTPQMAVTTT